MSVFLWTHSVAAAHEQLDDVLASNKLFIWMLLDNNFTMQLKQSDPISQHLKFYFFFFYLHKHFKTTTSYAVNTIDAAFAVQKCL